MSDPVCKFTTSSDLQKWYKGGQVTNGISNYGHQMAVYRGELYGIMTGMNMQLYATKFKADQGWKSFINLPSKFRSAGRVTVSVLQDRFYVAYRGTNDGVYLVYTQDFSNWVDVGRVGSKYAKTMVAPAMAPFGGVLVLAGVGADKYVYTTAVNEDGKRLISWKKVEGTGTQSALNMEVHAGDLYLFHTAWNNDKIFYQTFTGHGWSDLKYTTTNIKSGVSAVSWKYNEMFVCWRSSDNSMSYKTFDGKNWSKESTIGRDQYMTYQTGACTWGGEIFVSFGDRDSTEKSGYGFLSVMSEKGTAVREEEVDADDWDVKWKNSGSRNKSMIRKFFCL